MAEQDSDGEEGFVGYGKSLEPYEEGEQPKKPIPLQDQTVRDEKGRYKRFHGAFTGGFSAGYFNTVGSKEGWTPSTFVSSRQGGNEKHVSRPEDFMDDEDLGEFGIAPNQILTTDDYASKNKDRIREKARELAAVTAPIPGATILEELIAPAKITIGVQLLRQMGWKEGQGVGPRVKRRARKQESVPSVKMYGCSLPPLGSEGSEDEEEEYLPENITFAPKDVTPIDFTIKDNIHGLGYRGLDPRMALFGSADTHLNLFGDGSDKPVNLIGDVRHSKGRKLGISGQAFGVGALEDDDDDIYGTDSLSRYDTVLREETGDGLFGWTAPQEYKAKKASSKDTKYIGKMLEGFCLATESPPLKKVYPAPDLPRDYRPVHYFKPVLTQANQTSATLRAMLDSSQKPSAEAKSDQAPSRHQLNATQRRDMLGEEPLPGPTSVLDLLSEKDRDRIVDVRQTVEEHKVKAQRLAQEALKKRFQSSSAEEAQKKVRDDLLDRRMTPQHAGEFRPFEKNPEKQKRYENYIRGLHMGQKDALETCLDLNMTEWERSREREEFVQSAMLYKPSNSSLSSRFTRGKHEDNADTVEVPRDQEGDIDDKAAAVKMKMFGKLTRDKFEWHPDKLLCRRFNVADPYPGSTIVGLPKVKRDKFSVFNFLTMPETSQAPAVPSLRAETEPRSSEHKSRKPSRWDVSTDSERKDSLGEFLSQARSETELRKPEPEPKEEPSVTPASAAGSCQVPPENTDQAAEEEEKRPPIDLFKAIFADSSDEKTSSSEEDSDDEEPPVPDGGVTAKKPETVPLSGVQDEEPASNSPLPAAVSMVKDAAPNTEVVEEFGPRLPPAVPSGAAQRSGSLDDSSKRQKHRTHKDKHKVKKEHKHKKEKKKKHKKQKQKSKQKTKNTQDSSDSDGSKSGPSDTAQTTEITPRELLKRLKNLPIPHSRR